MTRLALALMLLLLVPATASAGGWTTVGLDQPPTGLKAGDHWNATFQILQHGRTPLDGEKPVLTIDNGTTTKQYRAAGTGEPGRYHADVVLPSGGSWQVKIDHGWGVVHRFAPIEVDSSAGAVSSSGGGDDPEWLLAAGAALVAGLLAAALGRRRVVPVP